ncbi:MAG: hypothetical protein ACW98D_20070 [Promethearchaeota archaeon]|jgi:hypothetical protein
MKNSKINAEELKEKVITMINKHYKNKYGDDFVNGQIWEKENQKRIYIKRNDGKGYGFIDLVNPEKTCAKFGTVSGYDELIAQL